MEVIRLRTMARKSVFDAGKWENHSVQQVLDLKGYRTLRWYYYNYSAISFTPDILDELGITEEWRIEKPGTDPEKYNALHEKMEQKFRNVLHAISKDNPMAAIKIFNKEKKRSRISARDRRLLTIHSDCKEFSRGAMQRRNQGHY